jgi:hypothetical protein
MRNVFIAGAALAIVFVVANFVLALLNKPNDLAVAAGYFVLVALVAAIAGLAPRLWRRL